MASFSVRGQRVLNAFESYASNFKRWDAVNLVPRIKFTSASDGSTEGTFLVTEDMCNIGGSLHGGFSCSVMDLFGVMGAMHHPRGSMPWTTTMSMQFVRRTTIGEVLRARCRPLNVTMTRALMECELINEKDAVVTKGTLDFFFPDPPTLFMDVFPYNPRGE